MRTACGGSGRGLSPELPRRQCPPPKQDILGTLLPSVLAGHKRCADIVLPIADGREIRLRRITEPTAEQKSLLHQRGLSLPERLDSIPKCSADSAAG
jgi:hypothetical protein